MLTNEEICSAIAVAFPPYRCVPEVWDYGKKLRFKVFDVSDKPIITMSEVTLSSISEKTSLESLCEVIRQRLQEHTN